MKKYYSAIDIGGSFIKYGVVSSEGSIIKYSKIATGKNLEELFNIFDVIIGSIQYPLDGIGISCPGTVDRKSGIVYEGGLLTYLDKVNLKLLIQQKYNIPCYIINDGKAALLAEMKHGNLRNTKNGAAIILGSGVGGGIFLNENVVEGATFNAGEFSFVRNREEKQGSISDLFGFNTSAVSFINKGVEMLNLEDKHDGEQVFEYIKEKRNEELNELFSDYCRSIANFIMNLQAILDLEKIVIGGGISAQDYLIQRINREYNNIRKEIPLFDRKFEKLSIEACHLGNSSNLLGAVIPFLM